jgi:HEAT repeat protein
MAASSASAEEVLTRMLKEGQSPNVRAGAAAVIGQLRERNHRPELEGALGDQCPVVRAAAANALGRIGAPESIAPLEGVTKDPVRTVAASAREAIQTIKSSAAQPDAQPVQPLKSRFGLLLGEMRNQTPFKLPQLTQTLRTSLEHILVALRTVAVFLPARSDAAASAQAHGLPVYRLDGSVTQLTAAMKDGQVAVHCEVTLLVMDRPTGSLRTLLRGAARALEVPIPELERQKREIAQRVVAGAVRSALRNADVAIADSLRRPRAP